MDRSFDTGSAPRPLVLWSGSAICKCMRSGAWLLRCFLAPLLPFHKIGVDLPPNVALGFPHRLWRSKSKSGPGASMEALEALYVYKGIRMNRRWMGTVLGVLAGAAFVDALANPSMTGVPIGSP